MKIPLFLNDEFCQSLDSLKKILCKAVEQKGGLYKDLLSAIKDGILEEWLLQGTPEEHKLAQFCKDYEEPKHVLNRICIELDLPTAL